MKTTDVPFGVLCELLSPWSRQKLSALLKIEQICFVGKKRGAKSDENVDIFYGGSNKGSYMYIYVFLLRKILDYQNPNISGSQSIIRKFFEEISLNNKGVSSPSKGVRGFKYRIQSRNSGKKLIIPVNCR